MKMSSTRRGSRSKPTKLLNVQTKRNTAAKSGSRNKTKHDRILNLLRAQGGTTIAALVKATGWQPHSVRGFLAGVVKKRLGLSLTSEKTSAGRAYRLVGAQPSASSSKAAPAVERPHG
jgi:hypothetical protein